MTNTLAYYDKELIATARSFIVQAPDDGGWQDSKPCSVVRCFSKYARAVHHIHSVLITHCHILLDIALYCSLSTIEYGLSKKNLKIENIFVTLM